jgi:hypothetical protein
MKNCYVNPKITERESYNVGSCFNNVRLLEYQKDMQLVRELISNREKQTYRMIRNAVVGVVAWGVLMIIIWFFLMPKV